jgi:chemosensory pili system protein ChpA (sensor histidine kinase/response regulator)
VAPAPITLDFGSGPGPAGAAHDLTQDDEMREIFLEEAGEVLAHAASAHAQWVHAPDDLTLATTLRRAFHTLKGSSRMVGLSEFGAASWACEQLYNSHLADQRAAQPPLLGFTEWALRYLSDWVEDIAAGRPVTQDAETVEREAEAVGAQQARAAAVEDADLALPLGFPPDLPSPTDLDLPSPAVAAPADEAARAGTVDTSGWVEPAGSAAPADLSFELDLAGLETPSLSEHGGLTSEHAELDLSDPTLLEPFDLAPTEPLPLGDVVEGEPDELSLDLIDLELDFGEDASAPFLDAALPASEDEHVKRIGPLRIGIPLFNIYLNEADELSRRLNTELAEWAMELHRPIGETPIALAHSLAGSSATVGFADLSHLARSLEHAQARTMAIGTGTPDEARLFVDAAEEIRRLLHQFAAGFLKEPSPELLARLAEHEFSSAKRLEAAAAAAELTPLAPADEPEAEAELGTLPEFDEPTPAETSASTFGPFEPLGVTELKPFEAAAGDASRLAPASHDLVDADDVIDAVDAVDAELFPIFAEEAEELLPQLAAALRDWLRRPDDGVPPSACMRALHTLKGGARLAGAMRLGEMAHRLESRIDRLLAEPPVHAADVETLQSHADTMALTFDALRHVDTETDVAPEAPAVGFGRPAGVAAASVSAPELPVLLGAAPSASTADLSTEAVTPTLVEASEEFAVSASAEAEAEAEAEADEAVLAEALGAGPIADGGPEAVPPAPLPEIDWSHFAASSAPTRKAPERAQGAQSAVRVRAPLLDRLVNQAGEVSITRSRIESGVGQIKGSLADLTENLERLRAQLRDIEFHGEMQMSSRLEAAKAASQSFDPLEFDRFTRFQELTRMMAESVNDVATVQRSLQRALETTEDELVAQARMTRELQDDLLRTRMVEFEGLSDRLYRVVRQAAKETGKSVRLDIVGGGVEVDRGVLDRMTGAFEHLVRNCVTHGIESPEARVAAGKEATGAIVVALNQEGNEVGVEFRDDGAGLDLERIRAKGLSLGLLQADPPATDAELANLIFAPGFSTADSVTELAGRGVGMDVVRAEVNAMGGRIETATAAGQGTSFRLILPLTTAVTQVVMLRCGDTEVAVPSTLVEVVRRVSPDEIDQAYASGSFQVGDRALQFFWLGALLQLSPRPDGGVARGRTVVVIRSAQQRIALHVDEVLGNQEVVVKNLGPQLSRLPGLAGVTLLASGAVALIYNPVALATLYGDAARAATQAGGHAPAVGVGGEVPLAGAPSAAAAPLVMVVDDSLTVRRVTQRLLQREGYRVVLAKDGLDALERLAEEVPQIVLSDIEMPRMDGFDLVRNMRADARLRDLPVIMITSRIAQKHRDYAAELGVDHYLGKPYSEEDLLALVSRYTSAKADV